MIKNKLNVMVLIVILCVSAVMGIFITGIELDGSNANGGGKNDIVDGGEQEPEIIIEEPIKQLEIVQPANALVAYNSAENYLKNCPSYQVDYKGYFSGNKSLVGININISEILTGKMKKFETYYYSLMSVEKNGSIGGNIYVRAITMDNSIINQVVYNEKKFDDKWTTCNVEDFNLFLNRKQNISYIKVDPSTIINSTGFTFSNKTKTYSYSLNVNATKAFEPYKNAINGIFSLFLSEYSYTFKSLLVNGQVDMYGRPVSLSFAAKCDVNVNWNGMNFVVEDAQFGFTETFSQFEKVTGIEGEFTQPTPAT